MTEFGEPVEVHQLSVDGRYGDRAVYIDANNGRINVLTPFSLPTNERQELMLTHGIDKVHEALGRRQLVLLDWALQEAPSDNPGIGTEPTLVLDIGRWQKVSMPEYMGADALRAIGGVPTPAEFERQVRIGNLEYCLRAVESNFLSQIHQEFQRRATALSAE